MQLLPEPEEVVDTVEVVEARIMVDHNHAGEVIGVEILGATRSDLTNGPEAEQVAKAIRSLHLLASV